MQRWKAYKVFYLFKLFPYIFQRWKGCILKKKKCSMCFWFGCYVVTVMFISNVKWYSVLLQIQCSKWHLKQLNQQKVSTKYVLSESQYYIAVSCFKHYKLKCSNCCTWTIRIRSIIMLFNVLTVNMSVLTCTWNNCKILC